MTKKVLFSTENLWNYYCELLQLMMRKKLLLYYYYYLYYYIIKLLLYSALVNNLYKNCKAPCTHLHAHIALPFS